MLTGHDDLPTRFTWHTSADLVAGLASDRPGDMVGYATRVALRELGRRAQFLDGPLDLLAISSSSTSRPRVRVTKRAQLESVKTEVNVALALPRISPTVALWGV